ncbi:PREDICTED: probable LRR receptor-like serine/threonine-protein kinase At1g51820 isoform X2 [Camelina sativa]|nr:PREDICTED: probable LRR receptor-like serine/threonine-protein kinase At1g51820 isoform X2 [Camelina sativa]
MTYTTDAKLVQGMPARRVDKAFQSNIRKQSLNLRFFPNGKRNCYKINVKQDTQYLIRATFFYGNYDGVNVIPTFELYLGPNIWAKVYANDTVKEVIHFTRTKSIQICLVDIGSGSPFINTLELRPLDPNAYRTTTGSLKKLVRFYLSNSTDTSSIRYPDDVYDRRWRNYFEEKLWLPITMGLSLDTNDNEYDPPEKVMQTAAIPIDANATLEVEWSAESPTTQIYVYLYFSELQILQANDTRTREFDVFLNGASFDEPISPVPLRSTTVFNDGPKLCTDGKCVLQLKKTSRSTLPPILSALEVYTVMDILQLETNDDDVNGIKDVQDTYDLRRITWQGDPCVPKQFLWEGLNCNQSDNSTPPTIISLDLSSSGLTGVPRKQFKV